VEKDVSHMKGIVDEKLRGYGFEPIWNETICKMISNVLSIPLDPDQKDFTLSHITNEARLNELGFYFPLKFITPRKLTRLFEDVPTGEQIPDLPGHMGKLNFSPVNGFMKGFVDLVFRFQDKFYIVDWKSNYLGSTVSDYGPEALGSAMKEAFYILQYHIYTVALHQYLNVRLADYSYKKHFGGVYYIFLRGVDPDMGPDYGVYRDRPAEELVRRLCRELIEI
jgi:exodeoxyribonuclease V beta subunit